MTEKDYNSDSQIKLRRYCNNLSGGGAAYILFGFWSTLRIMMELTMKSDTYEYFVENIETSGEYGEEFLRIVVYALTILLCIFIIIIHLSIGTSAIRYSRGKKKGIFFLVPALLLAYINIKGLDQTFDTSSITWQLEKFATIASFLVDLTVLFVLADMVYSTIRIKMLRSAAKENNSAG